MAVRCAQYLRGPLASVDQTSRFSPRENQLKLIADDADRTNMAPSAIASYPADARLGTAGAGSPRLEQALRVAPNRTPWISALRWLCCCPRRIRIRLPSENGGRSPREFNRSDVPISPSLPALRVQGNRNLSASSTNHRRKRRRTRYEGPAISRLFEDELSCAIKEFLS
jgi:hypothetical protein